jgi:tetratricopeptide (TPR) repeat protein
MDVARQSYNLGDRQRAIEIADSLLAHNQDADPGLRYTLLVLRADIHYQDQEFEQAREHYEQAMSLGYPLGLLGIGNMAVIKERAGQHAAADSCLSVISEQMLTPHDSTVYYSCQNKIQLLRGEYKDAYASAEEAMRLQNEDVRNELSRSLTRTQKAYFEERYISENAHNKILVLWFVLIATLLSIIILATYFALQRHKKQAIKEMERVEGLSMELSLLQERQKGAGAVLSLMVQDKIRAMQDLTDTYFSWTNEALSPRKESSGKQQKEDIIAQFRSELRSLRKDDQFIPNIEKALDLNCRGIISRLRSTFSDTSEHKMKELDFQLLVLFFAKFTPQSISFILDMTEESVRTRKSRYKKLFLSMGEAGSDFANSLS